MAESLLTFIILFVWPDVAHFRVLVPRYIYLIRAKDLQFLVKLKGN